MYLQLGLMGMEFEKLKKIIFRPTHSGETGSGKG